MPQVIDVPGQGLVEFPDGMDDGAIVTAIKANMPAPTPSLAPVTQAPLAPAMAPAIATLLPGSRVEINTPIPVEQQKDTVNQALQQTHEAMSASPLPDVRLPALPGQELQAGLGQSLYDLIRSTVSPYGALAAGAMMTPAAAPVALGLGAMGVKHGAETLGEASVSHNMQDIGRGLGEVLLGALGVGGGVRAGIQKPSVLENMRAPVERQVTESILDNADPTAYNPTDIARFERAKNVTPSKIGPERQLTTGEPPYAGTVRSDQTPLSQEGVFGEGQQSPRSSDSQRVGGGQAEPSDAVLREEAPQTVPFGQIPSIGRGIQAAVEKNREAASFFLPGPRVVRTQAEFGIAPTAKVEGQQLLNRVKNKLHPEEFKAYEAAGMAGFLAEKRTPEELAKWMEENGPRVETQVYGMQRKVSEARREYDKLTHEWMDALPLGTRQQVTFLRRGNEFREAAIQNLKDVGWKDEDFAKADRYNELRGLVEAEYHDTSPLATTAYKTVSAFPTDEPPVKGGIQIQSALDKSRKGESGAFNVNVLRDLARDFWDLVRSGRPTRSSTVTPGSVRLNTGRTPEFRFQPQNVEKAMALEYKGIGSVPGIGPFLDPRARPATPVTDAIITTYRLKAKARAIKDLFAEQSRSWPNPFQTDRDGLVTLANGSRLPPSDAIELAMGGTPVPFTPQQNAFLQWWRDFNRQVVQYAQSQGVMQMLDSDGNLIDVDAPFFPRHSYSKEGFEREARNTGRSGALPGGRKQFQRGRYYKTEAEGRAAGIKYEPDIYLRIAQRLEDIYSAIADERLAADPAMQGRPLAGYGPRFLEEGMTHVPAFRGRVFPREEFHQIQKHFLSTPPESHETVAKVNDMMRALSLAGDMSYLGAQQLGLLMSRPHIWAKGAGFATAAWAKPQVLADYLNRNAQAAGEFVELGGTAGRAEEYMAGTREGEYLSAIPVGGAFLQRAAHTMTTAMTVAKIEMYKALRNHWPEDRRRELVEAIENTVLSSPMEAIGVTRGRAMLERGIATAPSYYRAGLSQIANLPRGGPAGTLARETIGGLLVGLSALMVAVWTRLGLDPDEITKRLNPTNKNWLKAPVRLNNGHVLEVGPSNVALRMIQTLARMSKAATDDDVRTDASDELVKFAKYRMSPLLKAGFEFFSGRDVLDRKVTKKQALGRAFVPIAMQELVGEGSVEEKAESAAASFFGGSSRPESLSEMRKRVLEEGAKSFGKSYENLDATERAQLEEKVKPLLEQKRARLKSEGQDSQVYALRQQEERKLAVNEAMPADLKSYMKKHGVELPGYQEFLSHNRETLVLTPDEREALKKDVIQELEKAVRSHMNNTAEGFGFADPEMTQKAKDVMWERLMSNTMERVRKRAMSKLSQ